MKVTTRDAAVVVVRWKGGEEVAACLQSLLANGGGRLAEVVLVDSGSGDGGGEALAARFPSVRLLALPENRSFAWAADRGVEATDAPRVLLLNPDAWVPAGCIDTLSEFLDRRPQAAGAAPLLLETDGALQLRWRPRRLPGSLSLALGRAGSVVAIDGVNAPCQVPQPAAAAWLLRREVWDALGGLDPVFAPAWWEDVDFCARLRERCGQDEFPASEGLWLVPAARVLHQGGSTLVHLTEGQFLAAYHCNQLRYARRHHRRHAGWIRLAMLASLGLRAALRPSMRASYLEAVDEVRRCPSGCCAPGLAEQR